MPEGTEIRRCGLSLKGSSSFEEKAYPAILETRCEKDLVAIHPLTHRGAFDIFFSLHLLPEDTSAPICLEIRPMNESSDRNNLVLSSASIIPINDRPARTAEELLNSPEVNWYPREITELLVREGDRGIEAARMISVARDSRAVRALINDFEKRWSLPVCQALWSLGSAAIPDLISLFQNYVQEGKAKRAVNVLWVIRDPIARDFFYNLLKNPNPQVAVYAAGCLARMGDDSGLTVAIKGLRNPDPAVRVDSCWAIGKSRDEKARRLAYPVALAELNSENAYAKQQAMHALSNLRFREALPLYLEWIESDSPSARVHGVSGIARLNDPSLTTYLIEALRKEEDIHACLDYLNFIPVSDASRELLEIMHMKHSSAVRLKIIHLLGHADPEILPELRAEASMEGLTRRERNVLRESIKKIASRSSGAG